MDQKEEVYVPPFKYTHFVGIRFNNISRAYFFGTNIPDLKLDDLVVVETIRGNEVGIIAIRPYEIEKYSSKIPLKPVVRVATENDKRIDKQNKEDAKEAKKIAIQEINNLKLDMNVIGVEYVLDKSKIIISYVSEQRVDFRELLKVLAYKLRTRIELRQVGTRDKARLIGGIGICGLPLCCSSFLNEFDGISVSRAKNQMLAINIPKLSGHCGKLICCLKFEDDIYTEEKKAFPQLGERVNYENSVCKVTSMNILSKMIKIENGEEVYFVSLEEYNRLPKVRGKENETR